MTHLAEPFRFRKQHKPFVLRPQDIESKIHRLELVQGKPLEICPAVPKNLGVNRVQQDLERLRIFVNLIRKNVFRKSRKGLANNRYYLFFAQAHNTRAVGDPSYCGRVRQSVVFRRSILSRRAA